MCYLIKLLVNILIFFRRLLTQKKKANVNEKSENGEVSFNLACKIDHDEIVLIMFMLFNLLFISFTFVFFGFKYHKFV